jgi:hypothetical protein
MSLTGTTDLISAQRALATIRHVRIIAVQADQLYTVVRIGGLVDGLLDVVRYRRRITIKTYILNAIVRVGRQILKRTLAVIELARPTQQAIVWRVHGIESLF